MEFWLDTTNSEAVEKAARLGILAGITTNPSLLANDPRDTVEIIKCLLNIQEGPVAVQVLADDAETMILQGQKLYDLSERIIVKVPITQAGLEAIHQLSSDYIPTMATILFHPKQALMAAMAGANYIAPYISRIEKVGEDPWKILHSIKHIYKNYEIDTKILGASISSIEQMMKCAEMGIAAITLRDTLFNELVADDTLTLQGIKQFEAQWNKKSEILSVLR